MPLFNKYFCRIFAEFIGCNPGFNYIDSYQIPKYMHTVETLILDSLKEFLSLKCINDAECGTGSKLVYPMKRQSEKKRVSEQEMRCTFINCIEKSDNDFLYSIEMPTNKIYRNKDNDPDGTKRSGNIDLCLYENREPKHLIEFKALNPPQLSYDKDFEKLIGDSPGLINYFIQVLINTNSGTIPNIENKYIKAINNLKEKGIIELRSQLVIFLCCIGKKEVLRYNIDLDNIKGKKVFQLVENCDKSTSLC